MSDSDNSENGQDSLEVEESPKKIDPLEMAAEVKIKPKPKKNTLTYPQMIDDALFNLKERNGSSMVRIKNYMISTFDIKLPIKQHLIRKYLKESIEIGRITQNNNKMRYKLSEKAKKEFQKPNEKKSVVKVSKIVDKKNKTKKPDAKNKKTKNTSEPKTSKGKKKTEASGAKTKTKAATIKLTATGSKKVGVKRKVDDKNENAKESKVKIKVVEKKSKSKKISPTVTTANKLIKQARKSVGRSAKRKARPSNKTTSK